MVPEAVVCSMTFASSWTRSASGTPTRWPRCTRWSTASSRGATCGQSPFPCQECGHRFPLTGSLVLRHPLPVKGDPGQSYRIEADRRTGEFQAVVHDGPPAGRPTLVARTRDGKAVKGKSAVCPFCDHVHPKADSPTAMPRRARVRTPSLSPLTWTTEWARSSASRLRRSGPRPSSPRALARRGTAFRRASRRARRGHPRRQQRYSPRLRLRREDLRRPVQPSADARLRTARAGDLRPWD